MERLSMTVVVMVVAGVVGGWKKAQSRRDGMGWDGMDGFWPNVNQMK